MALEAAQTVDAGRITTWLIVLGAVLIGAGVIVGLGRRLLGQHDPGASLIRSWIAISLVIGLLFFTATSLALDDTTVRSVLIGAIAANAGAAVAYYFSSKASEQARKDILDATFGTETVPDLTDKSLADARAVLAGLSLSLTVAAGSLDTGTVTKQQPPPGSSVRKGTPVEVTLA